MVTRSWKLFFFPHSEQRQRQISLLFLFAKSQIFFFLLFSCFPEDVALWGSWNYVGFSFLSPYLHGPPRHCLPSSRGQSKHLGYQIGKYSPHGSSFSICLQLPFPAPFPFVTPGNFLDRSEHHRQSLCPCSLPHHLSAYSSAWHTRLSVITMLNGEQTGWLANCIRMIALMTELERNPTTSSSLFLLF